MIADALRDHLSQQLNTAITSVQSVRGGDINQAAKIETEKTSYFLKWNHHAPQGLFEAEAKGLNLLRAAESLRVPRVIVFDDAQSQIPAHLLLEWIPTTRPTNRDLFAERLGKGLATLHQQTSPTHGLDHDNFIGTLPQPNSATTDWATFYATHRIGYQAQIAAARNRLSASRAAQIGMLQTKMASLVPAAKPALLHGDLWGGNYLATDDNTPVIYDPAVYYGDREVELAFTCLFGGFPQTFYDAYHATYPLPPDFNQRISLYQLYPLMVHLNLFGGHYGAQVDSVLAGYI